MSRNVATVGIAVAVAVSFLFVGVGAVVAHSGGTDTGVSGHCTEGESGGGGSIGVNDDGTYDATNQDEIENIVAGLQHYGEQQQAGEESSDTCDGNRGEDSYDYIEAHAGNSDQQVQACFSEDTNQENPPISAGPGDQCEDPTL